MAIVDPVRGDIPKALEYDHNAPLDITVVESRPGLASRVQDIEYSSEGRTVRALKVEPPFTVPTGRAIFLPAAGEGRTSFLPDAEALAARGVASLIIGAPWSDPAWLGSLSGRAPEAALSMLIAPAIDALRGADVLTVGRPGSGTAFIGHGIGAMVGGLLSSDRRFGTLVLIAGVGHFADLVGPCLTGVDKEWAERFRTLSSSLDPITYVKRAKFASFLFQIGLDDAVFPRPSYVEFFDSAGGTKDLTWYEADHHSIVEVGGAERVEWLDVRIRSIG